MYGEEVYGVPVSARAYEPANKFMHSQVSFCGCTAFTHCLWFCGLLLVMSQVKSGLEDKGLDAAVSTVPAGEQSLEDMMKSAWIGELIQLSITLCFLAVVIAIGRHFIEMGSSSGMKLCCIIDGIYAGCGFFSGCCGCIFFCLVVSLLASMSNPTELCVSFRTQYSITTTLAPTVPVPTTDTATAATCEAYIEALKTPALTLVMFLGVLIVGVCAASSICAGGAKFAKETGEVFEDEEYGGMGERMGMGGGYADNEYEDDYY